MSTGKSSNLESAIAQAMGGGRANTGEGVSSEQPGGSVETPEGGWSKREKDLLRFGLKWGLSDEEALSLEGDDPADWRDQARRILDSRQENPMLKSLSRVEQRGGEEEGTTRQTLRSGGGSYGVGDDDSLTKDLAKKLGIPRLGRKGER